MSKFLDIFFLFKYNWLNLSYLHLPEQAHFCTISSLNVGFSGLFDIKKSLATARVARDSHYPLIYLYLKDLLKIGGRQLETVYNEAVWLHLHVQYIALNLCI